jgi:hypothetical protein
LWAYAAGSVRPRNAQDCVRRAMTESPVMALDETSSIMHTLDVIRERIGLVYPGERT